MDNFGGKNGQFEKPKNLTKLFTYGLIRASWHFIALHYLIQEHKLYLWIINFFIVYCVPLTITSHTFA